MKSAFISKQIKYFLYSEDILKFKHWQLFLLIIILGSVNIPSPFLQISYLFSVVTFTVWTYSIIAWGNEKIRQLGLEPMRIEALNFNILTLPLSYFSILIIVSIVPLDNFNFMSVVLAFLLILLSISALKIIIFACKIIKTIELKRDTTFSDYYSMVIMMVFLIIGIWILQPKINKIVVE
jgi:hypothetical protein